MKIREGFVSNSSSSSFVIDLRFLSEDEKKSIIDYGNDLELNEDGWYIQEDKERGILTGHTTMDNGSFGEWVIKKGFNKVKFEYDDYSW